MANYCMNSIYFCAKDKISICELFVKMRQTYETFGEGGISDLFVHHGYDKEDISTFIDMRDLITGCDGVVSRMNDYCFFSIETQSAWEPHIEVFHKLIREHYRNQIRILFYSEEPGDDIFVTNDVNGVFFTDRYRLCLYHDEKQIERYFKTWKEVLTFVKDSLHVEVSDLDSSQDVEEKIIMDQLRHYKDVDCFINRITVENEEERMVA